MLALLLGLPGMIGGLFGTINGITAALANAKIAQITATTQQAQIEAAERVNTLQARRDVLIAEAGSGSRLNLIIRSVIAIGPASVLTKLFLWDKVIGSLVGCSQAPRGTCGIFTTDALDTNMWTVITVVLGFYFVSEVSVGVARIIKNKG